MKTSLTLLTSSLFFLVILLNQNVFAQTDNQYPNNLFPNTNNLFTNFPLWLIVLIIVGVIAIPGSGIINEIYLRKEKLKKEQPKPIGMDKPKIETFDESDDKGHDGLKGKTHD